VEADLQARRDRRVILCRLDEIGDPGGKGVAARAPDGRVVELVVVRSEGQLRAYVNSCPHVGTPLETIPDRFFTRDGRHLLCTTHGARFNPLSGRCGAGPCPGQSLRAVAIRVEGASVVLAEPLS
jgi:nitrite reductase/ring-hydroxylating ferredoxin subunit